MCKKKVDMKKIEKNKKRHATFSKTKKILMNKAQEIDVLCGAQVSLIVFSAAGKLSEYSSSSPEEIYRLYQSTAKTNDSFEEQMNRAESSGRFLELPEVFGRQLDERYIKQLAITDLIKLEDEMDVSLRQIKTDLIKLEDEMDVSLRQIKSRKMELLIQSFVDSKKQEAKVMEEYNRLRAEMAARDEQREETEAAQRTLQLFL